MFNIWSATSGKKTVLSLFKFWELGLSAKCSFQDSSDSIKNQTSVFIQWGIIRRPSQGNVFSEVNYVGGSEDGEMNADIRNVHNGINFASWLHQFDQVQQQHRSHTKSQEVQGPEESNRALPTPETSRSSNRRCFY